MAQEDLKLIEINAKYLDAALEEERKELIDKACEWFEEVIVNVKFRKGGMTSCYTGIKSFIHNFRKAMEE